MPEWDKVVHVPGVSQLQCTHESMAWELPLDAGKARRKCRVRSLPRRTAFHSSNNEEGSAVVCYVVTLPLAW